MLDRFSELSRAPAQEDTLSPREVEVLQLLAKTTVNKEIATELLIGETTVKTHIILFSTNLESKDEPRWLPRPPGEGLSGFS